LAATDLGLGAVWTGVYPAEDRVSAVKKVLNLPANLIPLNVIPVGYPAGDTTPKDKWKAENLHWNKW
jgi:Nitroreductase